MPASPARVRHYTPALETKQAILWTFARVPLDGSTPSALSSGRAEASEGDLPQIASFNLDEVQTHLIITNHLVQTGGMLINRPFFDRLSKPDQDLIVKAAKDACDWANAKVKSGEHAIAPRARRWRRWPALQSSRKRNAGSGGSWRTRA